MEQSNQEQKNNPYTFSQRIARHAIALATLAASVVAFPLAETHPKKEPPITPPVTTKQVEKLTVASIAVSHPIPTPEKIPVPTPEKQAALTQILYTVKPNDTLLEIAENYFTTLKRIIKDNNLINPNQINIGQKLNIVFPEQFKNKYTLPRSIKQIVQQHYHDLEAEGKFYFPGELNSRPDLQTGIAHVYGLHKEKENLLTNTSSGERFDPNKIAVASWFYPLGTKVEITCLGIPGQSAFSEKDQTKIIVLVNDRGPNRLYHHENAPLDKRGKDSNVIKDVIIDVTPEVIKQLGLDPQQTISFNVRIKPVELPNYFSSIQLPDKLPHEME